MTVGAAFIIGIVGACVSTVAMHLVKKSNVDDVLDVFPCHGVGGTTGMILCSMFANPNVYPDCPPGLFYGGWELFWHHIVTMCVVIPFVMITSYFCYQVTNMIYPLRVSVKSEGLGLDKSQHNESVGDMEELKHESVHSDFGIVEP